MACVATTTTFNNNEMTTTKNETCLICFDDRQAASDTLVQLDDTCQRWVCRACLRFYLVQCEDDRKKEVKCPTPSCPSVLPDHIVANVLGRPYTPKIWCVAPAKEEDPDAGLDAWLTDNEALRCPNCHAWIIKEEGCDAVQCLCGMRLCWECRVPVRKRRNNGEDDDDYDNDDDTERCRCGHYEDEFYDNILEQEGRPQPKLASLEELRDMADFYERRKDEDCSDYEQDEDEGEDDDDETVEYAVDQIEEEDVKEEPCDAWIGSIFDLVEPAELGVFVGSILDWEEPLEVAMLVPLFGGEEEEEEDAEGQPENDTNEEAEQDQQEQFLEAQPTKESTAPEERQLVAPPKAPLLRRCRSAPATTAVTTKAEKEKERQQ